jgi:outer membrane biosynthesis protein TonB
MVQRLAILVVAVVLTTLSCQRSEPSGSVSLVKLSEESLWRRANHIVMPVFPESSVTRDSSGVAVSEIHVGVDGTVNRVDILQAPDQAIASAVTQALAQWTFPPISLEGSAKPLKVRGKLTFYFENDDGFVEVLSPQEKQRRSSYPGR